MTHEDFIRFFPQKRPKWVRRGYKVDAKALMRAVILAAKGEHWTVTGERGCREVWYNPTKPILFEAVGERANKYMLAFEQLLSSMVKEGILTYLDLGILEFRTLRELYESIEKAECWKNILLFVEKDGAYVHLKPLQSLFNITIMSGHGWSNTSGIERMLRELAEKGIIEIVVFTLTDYDPFGFAIAQEFVDKCETLGLYVSEHHRIGINVEHATPEILDVQKYPIKPGKRLSVNGVRFDSDRWLAEYGIDRTYGLEIEAVSAQPGGHQFLREIVAKELLKYLTETDRVEEITKTAWENAPFNTITSLMYQIDNQYTDRQNIEYALANATFPASHPEEYLNYEDYRNRYEPIRDEMTEETYGIQEEIEDLEEQLAELEGQKAVMEQPYRKQLDRLSHNYSLSRRILIYCLYKYYEQNKEKWPRDHYPLGFPEGCIVKAVEEQKDLAAFIKQVDDGKIIRDIQTVLKDALTNGEIQRLISEVLSGGVADE